MTELPVLKSLRCVLSCITEDDIPVLRQIFDDEQTRMFLSELRSLVRTNEGIRQMLSSFDVFLSQDEGMIWGDKLCDVMIGFVAVMDLSCKPTIVFAMHPDYRLKGYMEECVGAVVQYLLDSNLCRYIQTEVNKGNAASIRLLESTGFKVLTQDKNKVYLRMDR